MWAQLMMVPISPSIGIKEGARIALTSHTVNGTDDSVPYSMEAGFVIRSDGKLDLFAVPGTPPIDPTDEWVDAWPDSTYASDYEVQVTEDSQTGSGTRNGAVGLTWIDAATSDTNRTWEILKTTVGFSNWVLRVKLRHKASQNQYAEAVMTLEVDGSI